MQGHTDERGGMQGHTYERGGACSVFITLREKITLRETQNTSSELTCGWNAGDE